MVYCISKSGGVSPGSARASTPSVEHAVTAISIVMLIIALFISPKVLSVLVIGLLDIAQRHVLVTVAGRRVAFTLQNNNENPKPSLNRFRVFISIIPFLLCVCGFIRGKWLALCPDTSGRSDSGRTVKRNRTRQQSHSVSAPCRATCD